MPSRTLGPNRTHGRIATYNCGCHCQDCRRAAREHRARFRTADRAPNKQHQCVMCGDWFGNLGAHEKACFA